MDERTKGTENLRDDGNQGSNVKTQNDRNEDAIDMQDFTDVKVDYLPSPVKSDNDKKDYRVIKLPNGLTALLIADPSPVACDGDAYQEDDEECGEDEAEGDDNEDEGNNEVYETYIDEEARAMLKKMKCEEKMAACGLCIGVGSFSDPPEIPGLAHFLEHMVFMGSKKYPQENDFDAFITKRGGYNNASTECEETIFYFSIQEKHLRSALDRFAQFFISPLMKRDAMTRERAAVDSEFQMALPCDSNRKQQFLRSLAHTGHPATNFCWGNLITLRDNVTDDKLYEELHKFRERHYSAHRMTVTIQARLPLDTLEQYVKECFLNVPNNGLPAQDFTKFKDAHSFDTPRFRKIYKIKPVTDVCQIELTWTMPSLLHLYRRKPHQYVSWIIGHEGKGSLISYLRKKMWCLDIVTGNGESGFEHNSMYALFSVALILTDEGHKHLKEVLDAVYSYINLMRREGPQQRIYDEIHKIEETKFRFADEVQPAEYVENLCKNMHMYSPSDYINGSDLYFEYDPDSIKACMDVLTPENANIIIFDKKFNDEEFEKVEPWFKTKYADTEIPQDWIESWKKIEPMPEFHLPEPNIFITDDFSLIPIPEDPPEYPDKIHSDALSEIWYKPDAKFRLPECYMNFYYISPLALTVPENAAMIDIFIAILKQLLVEEVYPAAVAELRYVVHCEDQGLVVAVKGFNQKLPLLLTTITKYIAVFSSLVTEDLFDVMKGEVLKAHYNEFVNPGTLVEDAALSIQLLVYWTTIDKHTTISGVEFEQFKNFTKSFADHLYIKCLVQGNMTRDDVIANVKKSVDILNCGLMFPNTMPQMRVTQTPVGVHCCRISNFNSTDTNSVVMNYYQSGGRSIRLTVIIELLMMIMEEPLFNQLRTNEQLGYNVYCQIRETYGVLGFSVAVFTQADKYTTEHIDERIEAFLELFKNALNEMSDDDLLFVKEALTKMKQCADILLEEDIDKNWVEITSSEYVFDRRQREIEAINDVTIEDLREWLANNMIDGPNFRKLSVQVVGNDGSGKTTESKVKETQNSTVQYGIKGDYPLMYLTDLPNEKTKKANDYYITNIEDYKRSLYVLPVYKITK